MTQFNWSTVSNSLAIFGGVQRDLYVEKTGLPFFDVLRLYGALDLYFGVRDNISIHDLDSKWKISGKLRSQETADISRRLLRTAATLSNNLTKKEQVSIIQLDAAIQGGEWPLEPYRNVSAPLDNPDSALKDGIRGTAASSYKGLETGFGKDSRIGFADAILAYAGQKRSENIGGICFLPVFEGDIDLSKVISPLRAWIGLPNVLCAQVLMLLALKTALFADGYADRLSSVVYNTDLDGRKNFNYSGIIDIRSTALGTNPSIFIERSRFALFVDHFYRTFRSLVGRAWTREGSGYSSGPEVEDALSHARWLMEPKSAKNLSSLITSLERYRRNERPSILCSVWPRHDSFVKEIFHMSYGTWRGDHESLRKFAKAVASGIYYAREAKEPQDKRGKAWYDEATMLRSAPSMRSFIERAMILVEQGRRESSWVGSTSRHEDFNPEHLFNSLGTTRQDFETFRDLFRMYLVQESKPYMKEDAGLPETVPGTANIEGVDE